MNSSFTNQIDFLRISLLSPHLSHKKPGFRLVPPRTIPIFCTSHSIDRTFSPISSVCPHRWCPRITEARRGSSDILLQNAEGVQEDNVPISVDGYVYRSTLRLVECAMFAAVSGLIYHLSNSLAIENYFGCFFSLPIVMSSMRWGISAGRKTMVATAMLLLTISGPLRACTYLLMHGFVGLAMGSFWSLGANWILSITFCTFVRALGAMGYVLISSFLLRENILSLIAVNLHASLSYMLAALGVNMIPSMKAIYTIFGCLLLLNCGFFVFLLHILYAIFFSRLGMKASLSLPQWILHWQPNSGASINSQILMEVFQCVESMNSIKGGRWKASVTLHKALLRDPNAPAECARDFLGISLHEQPNKHYFILRSSRIVVEADSSILNIMEKLQSYKARMSLLFEGIQYQIGDFQLRVGKVHISHNENLRGIVMELEYMPISSVEKTRQIMEEFLEIWQETLSKKSLPGRFVHNEPNFTEYGLGDHYTSQHTAVQYVVVMGHLIAAVRS